MRAVLLSRDLLFITKIKEVAAAQQCELVMAKSESALQEAIVGVPERGLVLVDLEKTPVPLEVIANALSTALQSGWRCVCFFSHVHNETGDNARALGLGDVMPRSKFVQQLPHLLSSP
jgi:hypothetical protein